MRMMKRWAWSLAVLVAGSAMGCTCGKKDDPAPAAAATGAAGSSAGGSSSGGSSAGGSSNAGGMASGGMSAGGSSMGMGGGFDSEPCVADPTCDGLEVGKAKCIDKTKAEICLIQAGNTPQRMELPCPPWQECTDTPNGAKCTLSEGKCSPQSSRCSANPDKREDCDEMSVYKENDCLGCVDSPLGATCPGVVVAVERTGRVTHDARRPNDPKMPTDWTDVEEGIGAGLLVVSIHKSGTTTDLIDAQITNENGEFTIKVAETPTDEDSVVVFAVHPAPGGAGIDYALADPFPGQANAVPVWDGSKAADDAQFWNWQIDPEAVKGGAALDIRIPEAMGGGLLSSFKTVVKAREQLLAVVGKLPGNLVGWAHLEQLAECGACASPVGVVVQGLEFENQFYFSADSKNYQYYSDAVVLHEFGHWVMQAYGKAVGEGGPHGFNQINYPGLAWSEGWASAYGMIVRNDPVYYDKQQGMFLWRDFSTDTQGGPIAGMRPRPQTPDPFGAGLLQPIEEGEIAVMLWGLTQHPEGATTSLEENKFLMDALMSPRMTEPPFGGGYLVHRPKSADGAPPWTKTCVSAPHFADFLDAMLCAGAVTKEQVDAVTEPTKRYPYDSANPKCK